MASAVKNRVEITPPTYREEVVLTLSPDEAKYLTDFLGAQTGVGCFGTPYNIYLALKYPGQN